MASDARSQRHSSPESCTPSLPLVRFAETQKYGSGRSAMSISPNSRFSSRLTLRPATSETTGSVKSERGFVATKLRRKRSIISSWLQSAATPAPMIAPMLVPPTRSMGMPYSRSARTTPRCAKPRAPPPDRTMPMPRPVSSRATRAMSTAPRT